MDYMGKRDPVYIVAQFHAHTGMRKIEFCIGSLLRWATSAEIAGLFGKYGLTLKKFVLVTVRAAAL